MARTKTDPIAAGFTALADADGESPVALDDVHAERWARMNDSARAAVWTFYGRKSNHGGDPRFVLQFIRQIAVCYAVRNPR